VQTALFVLGTLVIQGGLVLLVLWLFTASEREAHRQEAQRRLAAPEAEKERLPKAA